MAIETLDDIIEQLMDLAGIYGAHDDNEERDCRVCATSGLRARIIRATNLQYLLNRFPETRDSHVFD